MLTRVLRTVKLDTIDRRSQVGCALRRIRENLVAQLGGPEQVTPTLAILIEQAAVKVVITKAVGDWILRQECPVRGDALVSVVLQHDTMQKTLTMLLDKIGYERRAAPVETLEQYIARKVASKADAAPTE
jgi:hypothetical protein